MANPLNSVAYFLMKFLDVRQISGRVIQAAYITMRFQRLLKSEFCGNEMPDADYPKPRVFLGVPWSVFRD
jgi:hypothetical protein